MAEHGIEITYYCEECGDSEPVKAKLGAQTDDEALFPVGWGTDWDGRMPCEEHFTVFEEEAERELVEGRAS